MSIKTITTDELRRMNGREALILQGCGGSLQEWVDGINDILTQEGILLDGTKFTGCSAFAHEGMSKSLHLQSRPSKCSAARQNG